MEKLEGLMNAQLGLLKHIAQVLERIATGSAPLSPGYRRRLAEYAGFDWSSIDAQVVAQDDKGAVEVEFNGHRFDRKSGEKFDGHFIIFSRPGEGWSATNKVYLVLIRFADYNKTPLAEAKPKARIILPAPPVVEAKPQNGENTPTAFWSVAAALIQAGRCTHPQAGAIAQSDSGTWPEKAARLLLEYGPLPETMPN